VAAYYPVGFFQELVDVVDVVAASCGTSLALLQELIEGWSEVGHSRNANLVTQCIRNCNLAGYLCVMVNNFWDSSRWPSRRHHRASP
jgi:hypothetical protein